MSKGVFKRPYVRQQQRQRSEEEVLLDKRLDDAVAKLVGTPISKDDWARAQYRASSRAGADRAYFEGHYGHADMVVMDAHVDQMFWQMVRDEMRKNPRFVKQMEFIESFYELPQHEFLERIKKRYWAQMQLWTDDRSHQKFLTEVWRAYHAAQMQLESHPYADVADRNAARERDYRSSANFLREEYLWRSREDPLMGLVHAMETIEEEE